MSLRLRLTRLYAAILLITLLGFGTALYIGVAQVSLSVTQSALLNEARAYSIAIHLRFDPDTGGLMLTAPPPHSNVQIVGVNGTTLYTSTDLVAANQTLPFSADSRRQVLQGQNLVYGVTLQGAHIMMSALPLTLNNGQVWGVLLMGKSLTGIDQTLETLRLALLIGGAAVLLLAGAAGWILSGAALRPIHRITDTADTIGRTQDFARRVDYQGPDDEVGRLVATLNTMLSRLQDAYQKQRRFVSDASHELRTPLTSIRGNLGLLQRVPPISTADQTAVLSDVVEETDRLSRLVADLLILARNDSGRQLRSEPVPLAPLITDQVRRLAVAHPQRCLTTDVPPPVLAIGDPDAIAQVLVVLLDNALKFTPIDGKISVVVDERDDTVGIQVRDTGCGIPADALPHIFDRFYQVDGSRTGNSAGLGLAIAQALIQAQHGSVSVQSKVGQGSIFTITLPRTSVALSALDIDRNAAAQPSGAA